MSDLSKNQAAVRNFIASELPAGRACPSHREIAAHFGFASSYATGLVQLECSARPVWLSSACTSIKVNAPMDRKHKVVGEKVVAPKTPGAAAGRGSTTWEGY